MASGRIRRFFNRIFGGSNKQNTEEQRKTISPKIKIQSQTSATTANTIRDAFRTVNERERTTNQNKGFEARKADIKSAADAVAGATSTTARERITPKVSLEKQLAARNRQRLGIMSEADTRDIRQNVARPAMAKTRVWARENFIVPMSSHARAADRARHARYMGDEGKSSIEIAREQKMGLPERNAKELMYETTYHPNRYAFTKGLASGATLGTTDLMMNYASDDVKAADQVYQDNKTGTQIGLEVGGNIIGSMATFGSTGDAMEQLVGRGAQKLAPGTATKIMKGLDTLAKKSPKAYGIVKALMNNLAVDVTTGGYSDLMHSLASATKDGDFDWNVFKKEMGINALWNAAMDAPSSVFSGLRSAREASRALEGADDALRNVDNVVADTKIPSLDELLDSARRDPTENARSIRGIGDDVVSVPNVRHELPRVSTRDVPTPSNVRNVMDAVDDAAARNADEVVENAVKQNADEVAEQTVKAKPPKKTKTETRLEEVHAEAESVNERMRAAHEAGNLQEEMALREELDDLAFEEADLRRKIEANRKRAATRAAKKNPPTPVPETVEEAVTPQTAENTVEGITTAKEVVTPPDVGTTINQAANASGVALDHEIKQNFDELTGVVRKTAGGEYDTSRGYVHAINMLDESNKKRAAQELDDVLDEFELNPKTLKEQGLIHEVHGNKWREEVTNKAVDDVAKWTDVDAKKFEDKIIDLMNDGEPISERDVLKLSAYQRLLQDVNGGTIPADKAQLFMQAFGHYSTQGGQIQNTWKYLIETNPTFSKQHLNKLFDDFVARECSNMDADELFKSFNLNGKSYDEFIDSLAQMAGHPEMRQQMLEGMLQARLELFRRSKPTLFNWLQMMRNNALLGSNASMFRNIVSNEGQSIVGRLDKKNRLLLQKLLSLKYGDDIERTSVAMLSPDYQKLIRMQTEGWVGEHVTGGIAERIGRTLDDTELGRLYNDRVHLSQTSIMGGDAKYFATDRGRYYDFGNSPRGKLQGLLYKVTNAHSRWVNFKLTEPDAWFVEKELRLSAANYLQANGIRTADDWIAHPDIVDKAFKQAEKEARENTYKEITKLGDFISKHQRAGERPNATLGQVATTVGIDATVPYSKVPINIGKQIAQHSPVNSAVGAVQFMSAARRGDVKAMNKAADRIGKGLTGIELMAIGFWLSGKDQTDTESLNVIAEADDRLKDYGYRDYSLQFRGINYRLSDLGPIAAPILMGAATHEALNLGEISTVEKAENILEAQVKPLFEMTLLQNVNDIATSFTNGESNTERVGNAIVQVGTGYVGQYIPTNVRAIARGTSDADLDTGIKSEGGPVSRSFRRGVNQIAYGLPVINEKVLAHKTDNRGHLMHERDTTEKKVVKSLQNLNDPFAAQRVTIPKSHIEQMKYDGEPDKFDKSRKYEIEIGSPNQTGYKGSKTAYPLTAKERENAARYYEVSGKDSANAVIEKGYFGDSQGARAKQFYANCPEDEEKALEYFQSSPEYRLMSDTDKEEAYKAWNSGRERTAKHGYYVDMKGNSETRFRFEEDLTAKYQNVYKRELSGIVDMDTYMDVLDATTTHDWDGEKNSDTVAKKKSTTIDGINSIEGLSTEQKIALYNALKHKNWKAWDGVSGGSSSGGYRNYRRSYGRRSGGSKKVATPIKPSQWKATSQKYSSAADAVRSGNTTAAKGTSVKLGSVKVTPPTPKTRKG